jgi:REP element-mobilizing transposase RayT
MARRPRLYVPAGLYHVLLRGNAKQPIFTDVRDRRQWQALLEEGLARSGHRLHAYCWMGNHVHMALQAAAPLASFVGTLASRYAAATPGAVTPRISAVSHHPG